MSAMLAFVISAFALTACSGKGEQTVQQSSAASAATSEQISQLGSLIKSFLPDSSNESSADNTSYAESSYVQSSYEEPSYTQPSYTQPSYTQPSYTQPSYTHPSYTQNASLSIKDALEADMGLDQVVNIYGQQFTGANMTVSGEYTSDDKITFYIQLTKYVDPNQSAVVSAVDQLAEHFESLSEQMAASIASMETQYNVRPFTMEFCFCNGDGSVLYSRGFTDKG